MSKYDKWYIIGKLFQKDEEGNELLIACVSRTFTKTERSYSTIKKEVLALLNTLRTMDFYIKLIELKTIYHFAKVPISDRF